MLNKIIRYSLNNRLVIIIASVTLLIWGLYTANNMEVDVFPDLNAPTVVVMTEAQGMAAEEVERMVSFPVETAVNGATDVRRVRSSSTTGFSVVWVEFEWGTDIYIARQIVTEKLATLGEVLPPHVGQPTLGPQSSILGEMMIFGITADSTSMQDLRTIADWTIRPRLLSTGGVAQVAVIGGEIKEYQILLDPSRMKYYNVTLDEVIPVVENMNQNAAGGIHYEYGNEYIIQGVLSTTDIGEIGKGVVKTVKDVPILLSDIADIQIGNKSPKLGVASERAKPAVLVTVTKQPNTNTMELTDKLDAAIEEVQQTLPPDVSISSDIFRQSRFIESSISNIQQALIEGAIFVIVVLFFFLMNVRTTLISLIAMPLSLLMAILALHGMGLTINTMSLGGLAIAIGSLVDDAIVDVENVYKRLRENRLLPAEEQQSSLQVVFEASKEVRMPILNSTLIIVACFLPLFFLSGMEGRMLIPLGIAFIVALFSSTIIALTLTPVMCSYMLTTPKALKKGEKEALTSRFLKKWYQKTLTWALHHKKIVLGITGLFLIVTIIVATGLGRSFLPAFNEGSLTINTSTMPGISLEESDKMGRMAEEILLGIPEIQTVARKTGRAELDEHALGVNVSEIEAPFQLTKRSREEFMADVREQLGQLSGMNIEIGQPISHRIDAMLSGTQANIAIKLFGNDLNKLYSIGSEIKNAVQDIEGVVDLSLEQQIERPQLHIKPKREMLAKFGIPLSEFSEFITTALSGQVVSQIYEGGKVFDLTLKMKDESRENIEAISNLMIDGTNGKIPLHYVAGIETSVGPNTISRENVQRKIVVSANVADRDLNGVVKDIQRTINEKISLPEGYHIEYGGQFESAQSASRILLITSAISIMVIFLLLFNEFRNASLSGIIMLNLPLAIIGGVIAIRFTSGIISIPAIIGFISLFGIATRNGILLVARYNHLQEEGLSLYDSILHGSLDRLNPILMTALTSALALIPLALGSDLPGNEIQSPMAQVILGGLLSSTLLNGFVVPIMYMFARSAANSKTCPPDPSGNTCPPDPVGITGPGPVIQKALGLLVGFMLFAGISHAQSGVDEVLKNVEANNKSLQANRKLVEAEQLDARSGNYPVNPTAEFEKMWGNRNNPGSEYALTVKQSLDFPGTYSNRKKLANLKEGAISYKYDVFRQELLLSAQLSCLEVIFLRQQQLLLQEQLNNAQQLADAYRLRFEQGDINQLELNKVQLELLDIRNRFLLNKSALTARLEQLRNLNGGESIVFEDTEYPENSLHLSMEQLQEDYFQSDPVIKNLEEEEAIAREEIKLNRSLSLPKIDLGYKRSSSGKHVSSNGFMAGLSIPLFEHKNSVKKAKAQAEFATVSIEEEKQNINTSIVQLYNQLQTLKSSREDYSELLKSQRNIELLNKALEAGQLSIIDYFTELTTYYECRQRYLEIDYEYHTTIARLFRYQL